jgi:hypothetical protein
MTCEHAFGIERARHTRMTSQGSAYSRFKRALATGNPLLIRSTAAELPRIELADALAICLALAEADDDAYGRVAARFTARWSLELPAVSVEEMQALGAALQALRAPDTAAMGRRVLAALVRVRGLERMERALAEQGTAQR